MLTQEKIEQFYKDVEALKLKFPNATITKGTGFSKGQVSAYLSKADEPSENFLKAFYEKFGDSLNKVPVEKPSVPGAIKVDPHIIELINATRVLAEAHKKDAEVKEIIAKTNQDLVEMLKSTIVGEQKESLLVLQTTVVALREFVIEQLLKQKEFHSRKEALATYDKHVHETAKKNQVESIQDGSGKPRR